jgi:hypothetical protein
MATEVPEGYITKAKYHQLVQKYNNLHDRSRELEKKYGEQKVELEQSRQKYKDASQLLTQWKKWLHKHWNQVYGDHAPTRQHTETDVNPRAMENKEPPEHATSSQTTEDDPESAPSAQDELSDDDIEVVSARPVKGKGNAATLAMPPPARIKQEPNSPENPIELASDDYSSPPLQRKRPLRTETSDLDELIPRLLTPRKRRRGRAVSEEAAVPVRTLRTTSSLSEGDVREDGHLILQRADRIQAGHQEANGPVKARESALQPTDRASTSNALRPLGTNVPCSPHRSNMRQTMKRKRGDIDGMPNKVAVLTEDGDMQNSQITTPQAGSEPKQKPDTSRRLDALLERPMPDKCPLTKQRTPEIVIRRPQKVPAPAALESNSTAFSKRPIQQTDASARTGVRPEPTTPPPPQHLLARPHRPGRLEMSPPQPAPEDEPIRSRPLAGLQLEDFRVNPSYLGADFAFADTFRGREQRRCLPGCTTPDCCGNAFRKAIEFGAIQSNKTDAQVLEEYLGPSWDHVLGAFTAEKRRDLLMQARAHSFANQHGKHRQAFERHKTPPGFWRTDMPTTQEEEEDRSRARELEKQKIEERWREALRPGGRWRFRDEVGG